MIAEAIDLGVVTVGGMVGVLGVVAAGAWWAASMSGTSKATQRDVQQVLKLQRDHGRQLDDHKTEVAVQIGELGQRTTRLELHAELTPIRGIPLERPVTGKHDQLRGDTPRPRRHEDTDAGESR